MLNRPHAAASSDGGESSDRLLETRQDIEHDLVAKINSTLDPLLGSDKVPRRRIGRVRFFERRNKAKRFLTRPDSVMVSSQKSEDTSNTGGAAGVPGTASNLPRPAPSPPQRWLACHATLKASRTNPAAR